MSGVSTLQEYQNFFFYRFVDDGSMEQQLIEFTEKRARLATNKYTFEDWKFTAHLLLILPPSYEHICDHYMDNADPTALVLEDVKNRILERECRLKNELAISTANTIARGPAPNSSKSSPSSPNNNQKKKSKRLPDDRPCFNCGKKGHWARECKAPKKSNAGPKSSGHNNNASLNVVETSDAESDSPIVCYFGAPENWLMDSGATDHMTPFIVLSYVKFIESRTVVLGDGSSRCKILGKGTIERWVETSLHHYRQLLLNDVLHVDGIKQRFLSMGKFDDKGFTITMSKSKLTISMGKFAFNGDKVSSLYKTSLYVDAPIGARSLNSVQALLITVWHNRMGHLNWEAIKTVQTQNPPLTGIRLDNSPPPHETCQGCVAGKAKRRQFKSSQTRRTQSSQPIEHIHSDLMGPMEVTSIGGQCFVCVFTCDYSSHAWVFLLKSKDQTLSKFKNFVLAIKKQIGSKIKYFRSDRGGEFMSDLFTHFLEEQGITRETSAPNTPQQNGVAERMNQTLIGGARALLQHSGMSKGFWAEALMVATHILNRSPRKGLGWRTPYELLYGHIPDISYFRTFGCRAWVYNEKGKKWDAKSIPMIFVGYETGSKAFRLWNPATRSIVISANVSFSEHEFPNRPAVPIVHPLPSLTPTTPPRVPPIASSSKTMLPPTETILPISFFEDEDEIPKPCLRLPPAPTQQSTPPASTATQRPLSPINPQLPPVPETPSEKPSESDDEIEEPKPQSEPSTPPAPRRTGRKRKATEKYTAGSSGLGLAETEGEIENFDKAYLNAVELFIAANSSHEPVTYKQAISCPDSEQWKEAMKDEITSLQKHETWEVVPCPPDKNIVSCKWVYCIKYNAVSGTCFTCQEKTIRVLLIP